MTPATQPYIELQDISISFGQHRVLDHVSFRVMPAETVCILGRSGVGKSVCLRIAMGFLKPDAGHVIVNGADITALSDKELEHLHREVTMVFQGALFDSLTVADNVAFPLRERRQGSEEQISRKVQDILRLVGIEQLKDDFPSEISMGVRRTVAIARALAAQPQCILYDEPTTMVDPIMARHVANLIRKLKQELNLTSVVVTHDTRLAERVADHIIFLDKGKVLFYGTVPEMERARNPLVREFLELDRIELRALFGTELQEQKVS
jgi:phospholipid/cholesterol/gamma-HCH transport system ATP-binding protein